MMREKGLEDDDNDGDDDEGEDDVNVRSPFVGTVFNMLFHLATRTFTR